MKKSCQSAGERGSALLIVFVFAAAVAIMLYLEMPVAVFEAQRNKEQLLIDRGNEYARGAKLYYRKLRQYPPTVEAMENTNRMRFLRKRFKDPFTGKDDWRLLHAAPNGMLTDSKVNPISNNIAGVGNSNGNSSNKGPNSSSPFSSFNTGSGFGSTNSNAANTGFGGFGSSSSAPTSSTPAEATVPAISQRPPAIAANGAASAATDNTAANVGSTPSPGLGVRNTDPNAAVANPQTTANSTQAVAAATGLPVSPNTQAETTDGSSNNSRPATGLPGPNQNPTSPQGAGTNPSRLSPFGAGTSSTNSLGTLQQGGGGVGIAGVASKAEGHSIKVINDQERYSLWEFYYDPTKDANQAAAGALAQMGGGARGGITGQSSNTGFNSGTNSSSGFGNMGGGLSGMQNQSRGGFSQPTNTNSGFGGFGSSGFGSSNTSSSPQPTTSTNPPQ